MHTKGTIGMNPDDPKSATPLRWSAALTPTRTPRTIRPIIHGLTEAPERRDPATGADWSSFFANGSRGFVRKAKAVTSRTA